jgi:hypothetical protein
MFRILKSVPVPGDDVILYLLDNRPESNFPTSPTFCAELPQKGWLGNPHNLTVEEVAGRSRGTVTRGYFYLLEGNTQKQVKAWNLASRIPQFYEANCI